MFQQSEYPQKKLLVHTDMVIRISGWAVSSLLLLALLLLRAIILLREKGGIHLCTTIRYRITWPWRCMADTGAWCVCPGGYPQTD